MTDNNMVIRDVTYRERVLSPDEITTLFENGFLPIESHASIHGYLKRTPRYLD